MPGHKVWAGCVVIAGVAFLSALSQTAFAQDPAVQPPARPTAPPRQQPVTGAAGDRPATPAAGQTPTAPSANAPNYIAAPQPAGASRPTGAPQPAAAQDAGPPAPRPQYAQPGAAGGQPPSAASTGQAPQKAHPAPRPLPSGAGVRPVQHQQPALPPLSPEQAAELDRILSLWEKESEKVKYLSANFTVWEYGDPFGKAPSTGGPPKIRREAKGEIHFAAPDKGSFRETEGGDERWMCDGTAIYEFKAKEKTLHEYKLPEELRGRAISKGPLPFVFGAKADMMKQRYAMRIITPADAKNQIWIEAWPRTQQDAANFSHVEVILDTQVMLPTAIRMFNNDHTSAAPSFKVYAFANTKVNGTWEQIKNFFTKPTTPPLWKRVVENVPTSAPAAGPAGPPSAQKPGVGPVRPQATADKRAQPAPAPVRPR